MRHTTAKGDWAAFPTGCASAAGSAAAVIALFTAARVARAETTPIVLDPPVTIDVLSKEGAQSEIRYQGQAAKGGKIDLTATNGFFDRCFEALDQREVIPGDESFIGCSFGCLGRLSDTVPGTARWHLWCAEAGEIKATFFMRVPAGEANHPWVIQVGDETQSLKVGASDGESPQERTLTFTVIRPGKVTFAMDCTTNPPAAETRIHFIRLEGSAIDKARLLRARWRPSAVHGHFFAPGNCPAPKMWVFETRNVGQATSYSPLTTPFGYFGTSFASGGRIPPGAGFNFSMWIAGRVATEAPPIEKMARLIGTDIPDAQYSTFGGEGTGVKFRATAYRNGADRAIQALRSEVTGDVRTFYGYFYDEQEQRWKLYASAQSPAGRKNMDGTLGSTGSFCEIPGPPNRERSGDVVRDIKRWGWFYGSDRHWYLAQLNSDAADARNLASRASPEKPGQKHPTRRKSQVSGAAAREGASSQRFYYMNDYATEGWIGMATGGMESYGYHPSSREQPARNDGARVALPEYLSPGKTAQLFELPVRFGEAKATKVSSDQATIAYEIKKTGPNSKAILYYGTVDCLTYPPQTVTKGSAVEIDMYRPERTWQSATPEQDVTEGLNLFRLARLRGGTTYYYRLFVTHDRGKSWDYRSGSFRTQ